MKDKAKKAQECKFSSIKDVVKVAKNWIIILFVRFGTSIEPLSKCTQLSPEGVR